MLSGLRRGILRAVALAFAVAVGGCAEHARQAAPQTLSVGSRAPDTGYALTDGRTISSADLAGHPYMLWIMATWCSSCQGGMQTLAQHIGELRARGVRVVQLEAVNDLGYPGPPITAFQTAVGPAGRSPNWFWGTATAEQMRALDPNGYPDIYYLVNADGTIAAINGAPAATWNEIEQFADSARRHGASSTLSSETLGGQITVLMKAGNVVQLSSNRFTCASCARRVIPAIRSIRGVRHIAFSPFVGVSRLGSAPNGLLGTLTVTFDPRSVQPGRIALVAVRALEADPYNRDPVSIQAASGQYR